MSTLVKDYKSGIISRLARGDKECDYFTPNPRTDDGFKEFVVLRIVNTYTVSYCNRETPIREIREDMVYNRIVRFLVDLIYSVTPLGDFDKYSFNDICIDKLNPKIKKSLGRISSILRESYNIGEVLMNIEDLEQSLRTL